MLFTFHILNKDLITSLHPLEQLRVKTKIALADICTSNTPGAMAGDGAAAHR